MATVNVRDYATGKSVRETPEEAVRQDFEHILIDELGYPKTHIDIEFPIQRGSKKKAESADIVVFRNAEHAQGNVYLIVETKAPGGSFNDQGLSYATATTAEFMVLFDGLDRDRSQGARYFWRDLASAPTVFQPIPALPHYGETLEEIGEYKRHQLVPALRLKGLFQKMHNRLYGEGPFKREDLIAQEVIKMLFCKLYDELYSPGETCVFRATVSELRTPEGQRKVGQRVRELFGALKEDPGYGSMFRNEEIQYDDYWISYIVSELQRYALTDDKTDTDAMGDAYEIFVGPQLKGESGQFFTPRPVVRLAVEMLSPSFAQRERVIDPACGSAGFLVYALRCAKLQAHAQHSGQTATWIAKRVREYANGFITGMDTEPLLHRVARSYMAIVGNGKSGIFREDSLLRPEEWDAKTRERVQLGAFDVLLTNPPFGTGIKVEREGTTGQYALAHVLSNGKPTAKLLKGGQDPSILFLERSWQLLRPCDKQGVGGRMAIVLPRQILSGHDSAMMEIRKWILDHMKILAVVDLPSETFQPYTGTITSILLAERAVPAADEDYRIFMGVVEHVGHDRRGHPLYARDETGAVLFDTSNNPIVRDDLPEVLSAYQRHSKVQPLTDYRPSVFSVSLADIKKQARQRLDAWYYDPSKNDIVKHIWGLEGATDGQIEVRPIRDLIANDGDVFYPGRHRRNYVRPGPDAVPFLSSTNILQTRPFDVKWQPKAYRPAQGHLVKKGWILVTRSGSVGRVVYVGDDLAGFSVSDGVAVTEHAIRVIPDPSRVDPGYLFAFLSTHEFGEVLLTQGIYASVVEHISPDHIKDIPIPLPEFGIQRQIGDRVRAAEKKHHSANAEIAIVQKSITSAIDSMSFE